VRAGSSVSWWQEAGCPRTVEVGIEQEFPAEGHAGGEGAGEWPPGRTDAPVAFWGGCAGSVLGTAAPVARRGCAAGHGSGMNEGGA
jgi:hypothetical protein